jgi:hypothetical protein
MRNCTDCVLVVACQQLRVKACKHVDIQVFVSATQPVIEDSRKIRFGCFDFAYFSLAAQFERAELNPWNSEWSNVHDFHANRGANWSFLDAKTRAVDLIPKLRDANVSPSEIAVTPVTWGSRPVVAAAPLLLSPSESKGESKHSSSSEEASAVPSALLIVFAPHHRVGYDMLQHMKKALAAPRSLYLVRTRVCLFAAQACKALFGAKSGIVTKAPHKGKDLLLLGLEVQGIAAQRTLEELCTEHSYTSAHKAFVAPAARADAMIQTFFAPLQDDV